MLGEHPTSIDIGSQPADPLKGLGWSMGLERGYVMDRPDTGPSA